MNLRVFTPARFDTEGRVTQEPSDRTLRGIIDFHIEFPRNTFTVTHRMNNGALVTETLELHRMFKDGELPDFLLGEAPPESSVGQFVDPTTVSTAGVTGVRKQDEVTVTSPTGNQESLSGRVTDTDGAPKTSSKQPLSPEAQATLDKMRAMRAGTTTASTETEREKARLAEKDGATEGVNTLEQPNTTDVSVASGVGHLTDPTTVDTGGITGNKSDDDFMKVGNPGANRQGPSNPPDVNAGR